MSEKRNIKLTPEQLRTLREHDRKKTAEGKMLWELFRRLSESIAKEDEDFWEQVHSIAGTTEATHTLRIRWATGDIETTELKSNTDDT